MKVRLERSGGIAGLTMVAEVDTDAPECAPDLADHARAALSVNAPRRRRPSGAADPVHTAIGFGVPGRVYPARVVGLGLGFFCVAGSLLGGPAPWWV